MPPESTTRLTPIQSEVLCFAAKCARESKTRMTLQDYEKKFQEHRQATAVSESIYELLEAGLLAEYRDKRGGVVPKNYVVTDAGKDQAVYEADQRDTERGRRSKAALQDSRKSAKPARTEDEWDQPEPKAPAKRKARRKVRKTSKPAKTPAAAPAPDSGEEA